VQDGGIKCGKMEEGERTIYEKITLKLTILRRNAEILKDGITEQWNGGIVEEWNNEKME
jgi:hypothetical protein